MWKKTRSRVDKEAQKVAGTAVKNVFYAIGSFQEVLIFGRGLEDKQHSRQLPKKNVTYSVVAIATSN